MCQRRGRTGLLTVAKRPSGVMLTGGRAFQAVAAAGAQKGQCGQGLQMEGADEAAALGWVLGGGETGASSGLQEGALGVSYKLATIII